MHDHTDTWGIPSQTFLQWYLVAAAVAMLMAERPDLILLGGDYVSWRDQRYVHPAADALAPLTAPHGVIAILGNHDDEREMPAALAAKGDRKSVV